MTGEEPFEDPRHRLMSPFGGPACLGRDAAGCGDDREVLGQVGGQPNSIPDSVGSIRCAYACRFAV